jgi:trimethylamine:corrinoid methyltransferase-like protein
MTAPSDRRRGRRPKIWKDLLQAYEQPPMDPAVDKHLREYVTKRKQELNCS